MPQGSWLATIDETSGITQRSAQATIDFYPAPPNHHLYLILAVILLIVLLLLAGLFVWLIRRNRRSSPITGDHLTCPVRPGKPSRIPWPAAGGDLPLMVVVHRAPGA